MEFMMSMALAGIAAAAAALALHQFVERRRAWRLGGLEAPAGIRSPFLGALIPISNRISPLAVRLMNPKRRDRIERSIIAAGLDDLMDAPRFFAIQIFVALASSSFFALCLPWNAAACAAAGGALGWGYTALWLGGRVRQRREAIELALPGALDWLALSVEAGQDFAQALAKVSSHLRAGPLKNELARLDSAMRMGSPRREALSAMARRANVPSLVSFCALLIQADRLGTGIGPVLRTVADRLRTERFARAERRGMAAAQKALLPLVLCIMPVTFIVVFGPLIARLVAGGFDALF